MRIKTTAYAKVNPVLGIAGVDRGLHLLDTVVLPVAFGDIVEVSSRADREVIVSFSTGEKWLENTARSMAETIVGRFHTTGVEIRIEKRIPVGAGLGGSSADAAAVARAMIELYGLEEPNGEFFRKIGSDVYAQYLGRPVRITGTGGEAAAIENFPKLYVAILAGGQPSMTKEAFRRYDLTGGDNPDVGRYLKEIAEGGDPILKNALERAAAVEDADAKKTILNRAGFRSVGMTGSGSAYAGYSRAPIGEEREDYLKKAAEERGLTLILTETR